MEKKTVSAIMLTLLLTSMLTLVFSNQLVKAESEVIIDTHNDSRFAKYPSGPYWWSVADHDVFHTRAYNNNFWYTYCGAEGQGELYFGTWQASLPQSGEYEVFVWIPDPDAFGTYTPTQSAVYQIYYQGGMTTKTVNQRLRTGGWYSLGRFTFGTSATIMLNDRTGESYLSTMLAFDAIKFVGPRALIALINPLDGSSNFSFTPAQKSLGDNIIINITGSNFVEVSTWQVHITWDPTLLDFVSFTFPTDNIFAYDSPIPAIATASGDVVAGYALGSGASPPNVTGGGTLAQLKLKIIQAVGQVSCNIDFEPNPPTPNGDTFLLQGLLTILPAVVGASYSYTSARAKFKIGDWVQTTANLNVRQGPGLSYTIIDTLSEGNFGEIVGEPVEADGHIWWKIDYAVGTRGWSVEEGLELVVPNQSPSKPTDVAQYGSDGVTVIPEGDRTPESTVVFKGVVSDPDGDLVRFEIELRKIDEAFVGNPTSVSGFTLNSIEMAITCNDLSSNAYHWQYRAKDVTGATSDWTEFTFYDLDIDFTVYFDNQPPDTIIRYGPSGSVSENDVTFGWMGVDDSGAFPNLQFQYFLQNYDYGWSEWSYKESVQYPDLPNGDYIFKVRARDESLNVDPTSDERGFSVCAPPFTFSPERPKSGEVVTFTATGSYDWYLWKFGDGEEIETIEPTVSHRFRGAMVDSETHKPVSKRYTVKLMMEDKDQNLLSTYNISITVEPLTKRVELSPTYLGIPYMEATYNWVGTDEATGEDLYIISRIDTCFGGALGASQFFIVRRTSPSPSLPEVIWHIPWPTEWAWNTRTYYTPFAPSLQQKIWGTTCQLTKETYSDDGTFEGIGVTTTSFMVMVATGAQITMIQAYWDGGWARFDPSSPADRLIPEDMQALRDLAGVLDLLKKFIELAVLSPCELRIYDSQGRVTGLVNGEEKEEIPGSMYFNNTVIALYSNETYRYELVGTGQGVYGLKVILVEGAEITAFTAADIPTSSKVVHEYTVDWAALSRGEEGVTVQVDLDGNGVFERNLTSDSELTRDEYVAAVFTADINGDKIVNMRDVAIAIDAFNSFPTRPRWNPYADLDASYRIDMRDIAVIVMGFNKHYP